MENKFIFPDEAQIRSPLEFLEWIHRLKEAIQNNIIEQVSLIEQVNETEERVLDIQDDGPWPDYIEWYFHSLNDDAVYQFSVETYHGIGGSWLKVNAK